MIHSGMSSYGYEHSYWGPYRALQLNQIMKAMPEKIFQKSLPKAIMYMLFDYAMWGGSMFAMWKLKTSPLWATMAMWQKAASSLVYWNVAGFFMWCIFVVGHDCGHTTFSDNKTINDIFGHIMHGSLLVPFYPWQVSFLCHYTIDIFCVLVYPHYILMLIYIQQQQAFHYIIYIPVCDAT